MSAAQEFSSPAAHMVSIGKISGPAVSHGPNDFLSNKHSNVIYSPGAFKNINNGFVEHYKSNDINSAKDYDDFNERYMRYNEKLFNSAKDYDSYMSNTAIRRQVEDLKAAGLNPVLAAHLGGATYKGVNAPYLQISPASALNSMLDYSATMYATDVNSQTQLQATKLKNDSDEFIAQYNKAFDMLLQNDAQEFKIEFLKLSTLAQKLLDNNAFENQAVLQYLGFKNEKELADFKEQIKRDTIDFERINKVELEKSLYYVKKWGVDFKDSSAVQKGFIKIYNDFNILASIANMATN